LYGYEYDINSLLYKIVAWQFYRRRISLYDSGWIPRSLRSLFFSAGIVGSRGIEIFREELHHFRPRPRSLEWWEFGVRKLRYQPGLMGYNEDSV
jgi:hypothetical protein